MIGEHGLLGSATVNTLITPPDNARRQAMGWAPVAYDRGPWSVVELAQQGSNQRWVASAVLGKERNRAALVVCNDGRTRVLRASARFGAQLLSRSAGESG